MVIFRQIAAKIRVNSYKISSYKSRFLVKILLIGKWLIFNSFENCDQIAIAAAKSGCLAACLPGAAKKFTPGIPGQIVWFFRHAESGVIQLDT